MADEPNPIDIEVGRRLKQRRTLLGMSQERLGDLLGITYQQIQKYERGTNRIGSSRLYDICRILDVPSSYFIEGAELPGRHGGSSVWPRTGRASPMTARWQRRRRSRLWSTSARPWRWSAPSSASAIPRYGGGFLTLRKRWQRSATAPGSATGPT